MKALNYIFILAHCINIYAIPIPTEEALTLTQRQLCDLELILNEGFAPLKGFMCQKDYEKVVKEMRLTDGTVWPIPITLDISEDFAKKINPGCKIVLKGQEGHPLANLYVEDVYKPNKTLEAQGVFATTDTTHPGVNYLFNNTKNYYVGGKIEKISLPKHYDFVELRKTPKEIKDYFKANNINKIVAFQTRNPMHRAHIELTIRASRDLNAHLLIHPAVGLTKPGDVDHFTRVKCYKKILNHFPKEAVTLSLLPISMRMAGPREALWHAIIRKNYGVTHFIVGRDHAGPGKDKNGKDFYGPYDAQELVKQYQDEIGIKMVPFKEMVYVPSEDKYFSVDEISVDTKVLNLSGTQLRKILQEGKEMPAWFTYPEIAEELRKTSPARKKQGFTIFFTGLSGAGKSTIANALAIKLMEIQNRKITLLDGDVVRLNLSKGLGFSKEDRSTNVRRVGFVSNEITKNGGIALCALVSPYESDRQANRRLISENGAYIEVHVATSLAECEARDEKGLYAQAKAGKIPNFTGISDPYEAPSNPELVINTEVVPVNEAIDLIIDKLKKEGYLE